MPTIKELYSLIDFSGVTGTSASTSIPYIDTDYFDFAYGDESAGERFIDAQYWSSTEYVGTTMGGSPTTFGVNFADGRIKGYGRLHPQGGEMVQYVRCVRGNAGYGINDFADNGDGTITDHATSLMWTKTDSSDPMNWEAALAYAGNLGTGGYADWRLPNAKELQSIVDYARAPDAQDPAQQGPAIDPLFEVTETESWCWTSTTHLDGPAPGGWAAYVCFGQAWGYMGPPGQGQWLNVHGAGAQRSDPKSGDPAQWPYGHGPQGDEVRIDNYVRCVRDASTTGSGGAGSGSIGVPGFRAAPNPARLSTTIEFDVPGAGRAVVEIFDVAGRRVMEFHEVTVAAGRHAVQWDGTDAEGRRLPQGVYFIRLGMGGPLAATKITLID